MATMRSRPTGESSAPTACTATTSNAPSSPSSTATPVYFTFKEFLSAEEEATFFGWDHGAQVEKVASYLDFVAAQPAATQFTSSKRASVSWAEARAVQSTANIYVVRELLDGRTKSGFGAFGSEDGFLPQKELSLAVARSIESIGHEYIVEHTKSGELRPRVLNSRSFYLNWCHAEKQKLMDVRQKLARLVVDRAVRRVYWESIVVVVDRAMCPDCIQYAHSLAANEGASITVRDPALERTFPPSKHQSITTISASPS